MTLHLACRVQRGTFLLDVDTQFNDKEVTALFGASGSGKTSMLRLIAGLDREAGVRVSFNNDVWQDDDSFVPPHERRIGYIFQHLNLFPNMNADQNLDYAAQRAHSSQGLSRREIVEVLDIGSLLNKYPEQLSGGEKQRIAIARSLLSHPRLLLMDEPLGSIDHAAKNRILPYLQRIHQLLDIPVIFVSHSLDEVLYLADTVTEIHQGKISQQSSVISFATSDSATSDKEAAAIVKCQVQSHDRQYNLTTLTFENQPLIVSASALKEDDQVRVKIPARDVSIARERATSSSILNVLQAVVVAISDPDDSPAVMVTLQIGNQSLLARVTRKSVYDLSIQPGDQVFAQIKGVALMIEYDR